MISGFIKTHADFWSRGRWI